MVQEDGQVIEKAADGCEFVQYSDIRLPISVEIVHCEVRAGALRESQLVCLGKVAVTVRGKDFEEAGPELVEVRTPVGRDDVRVLIAVYIRHRARLHERGGARQSRGSGEGAASLTGKHNHVVERFIDRMVEFEDAQKQISLAVVVEVTGVQQVDEGARRLTQGNLLWPGEGL